MLTRCLFSLRGLRVATVFSERYGHPGGHQSDQVPVVQRLHGHGNRASDSIELAIVTGAPLRVGQCAMSVGDFPEDVRVRLAAPVQAPGGTSGSPPLRHAAEPQERGSNSSSLVPQTCGARGGQPSLCSRRAPLRRIVRRPQRARTSIRLGRAASALGSVSRSTPSRSDASILSRSMRLVRRNSRR